MEFGIFNDEGCIEAGFFSREEAEAKRRAVYTAEYVYVADICPDHEGQDREHCEVCAGEE